MKLCIAEIREIATGAARVEEENGSVRLYRFTKEQEEIYKLRNEGHYRNSFSTAGVKLSFRTDSKHLFLKIAVKAGSSRKYFSLDVFVDGNAVGYIDNFSHLQIPQDYHALDVDFGEFSQSFSLGDGVKTVCVHMPWSTITSIVDMELDDGASFEPVKPTKKLLVFGDSITQGYDALRPSLRYAAMLAAALGAEEFNKAIGGERFFPGLASLPDNFNPDYITVAYGTNDWSHASNDLNDFDEQSFRESSRCFFENLRKNYPHSKIFAITPIWRADFDDPAPVWKFEDIEEDIRKSAAGKDITVVNGFEFVPADVNYFADLRLHPNDDGFEHYFKNLYNAIKNEI